MHTCNKMLQVKCVAELDHKWTPAVSLNAHTYLYKFIHVLHTPAHMFWQNDDSWFLVIWFLLGFII